MKAQCAHEEMTLQTAFQTSGRTVHTFWGLSVPASPSGKGELPTASFSMQILFPQKSPCSSSTSFLSHRAHPSSLATEFYLGTRRSITPQFFQVYLVWLHLTAFPLHCSLLAQTVRKRQLLLGRLVISLCSRTTPRLDMKSPQQVLRQLNRKTLQQDTVSCPGENSLVLRSSH